MIKKFDWEDWDHYGLEQRFRKVGNKIDEIIVELEIMDIPIKKTEVKMETIEEQQIITGIVKDLSGTLATLVSAQVGCYSEEADEVVGNVTQKLKKWVDKL